MDLKFEIVYHELCGYRSLIDITAILCVMGVQLSSIVLKQYVETHWCHLSEKFHEPEPPEQVSELFTMKHR